MAAMTSPRRPELPVELLAEVADRMAPDFEVYEVTPAAEVFAQVQAQRREERVRKARR